MVRAPESRGSRDRGNHDDHELLPYMVEFNENGSMKPKEYPNDCRVGGPDRQPIIFITHGESIFSANDGRRQAWMKENHIFLRPKGKGKGIMVSDFLLPWSRLNLLSLLKGRQEELAASGIPLEAAVLFEYGKEEGHWVGEKLLEQLKTKARPIATALYPGYQFLFLFDNATSHAVYAHDALRVVNINKGTGGQQPLLRDGDGEEIVLQQMYDIEVDPATGNVEKSPKEFKEYWRNENYGRVERNCSSSVPSHAAKGGKIAKIARRAQGVNPADRKRFTAAIALRREFVIIVSVGRRYVYALESNCSCAPRVKKGRKKAVSNAKVYQLSAVQMVSLFSFTISPPY
jgi:hypothetical protein